MADETVTTNSTHDRAPASHTTVVHENRSSGSGAGILIAIILLIAVIAGIYLFSQSSSTEAAKDNAITNAANSVGTAAEQVGDAAQGAVGNGTE